MTISDQVRASISDELERLEEDCTHSSKSQFNASDRWSGYHYYLSVPSIALSAAAGAAFFKDYAVFAGVLSSVVAVLTSLLTLLKPSERSAEHKNSGSQYLALRNQSRVFREVSLQRATDEDATVQTLTSLTTRRDELNQAASSVSDKDRRKARQGIEEGEAKHLVDRNRQQ